MPHRNKPPVPMSHRASGTIVEKHDSAQYKIVRGDSAELLEAAVNDLLSQGWTLQGGVSTILRPNMDRDIGGPDRNVTFYQSMVRVSPNTPTRLQ